MFTCHFSWYPFTPLLPLLCLKRHRLFSPDRGLGVSVDFSRRCSICDKLPFKGPCIIDETRCADCHFTPSDLLYIYTLTLLHSIPKYCWFNQLLGISAFYSICLELLSHQMVWKSMTKMSSLQVSTSDFILSSGSLQQLKTKTISYPCPFQQECPCMRAVL